MRNVFQSRSTGTNIQNLSSSILNYEIPVPPIGVQQRIVYECNKIDEEYNTSRMSIEVYRQKIAEIFDKLEVVSDKKVMGGG